MRRFQSIHKASGGPKPSPDDPRPHPTPCCLVLVSSLRSARCFSWVNGDNWLFLGANGVKLTGCVELVLLLGESLMRRFALLVVVVTLLTGSVAQAASYQNWTNGDIVDPILDTSGNLHPYSGPNLEQHMYLSGADLEGASLIEVNLHNAHLSDAKLAGADLRNGFLSSAYLYEADLNNAKLAGANLSYTDMRKANLWKADFWGDGDWANLREADLRGANLSEAIMTWANALDAEMEGANLSEATLYHTNFYDAQMYAVNMTDANASEAQFCRASLSWANMSGADLSGADLSLAYLSSASLAYANLSGADLEDTKMWKTDLYGANLVTAEHVNSIDYEPYYYLNTNLPPGFDPVAKGWNLSPYCDFPSPPYENASYKDPDAACDVADINQMFGVGDLVTGVAVDRPTDRLDLVDNDTIDAADITEWLSQAATENGHSSAYLRGDTDLDRNVDLADYSELASNFDPTGSLGPHGWDHGNSDGDNDVDLADYNVLASNFSPAGYGDAPVPEPSTALLALLGMLLISVFGRLSV